MFKIAKGNSEIKSVFFGNQRYGLNIPIPPADADATAFLTAADITDPTITSAINTLVVELKDAGLWNKIKALYPFVGGTATTHKYNLKDPRDLDAAFRLTYSGGITHDANGIQGNGSNGFFNTHLNASVELGLNNAAAFMYIRNNVQAGILDFGVLRSSPSPEIGFHFNARNASNRMSSRVNGPNPSTTIPSSTTSIGFFGISRTGNLSYTAAINKSKTTLISTASVILNLNIFGLACNRNGTAGNFSSRQQALFSIGDGLVSGEIDDFVDINQTFQTTLGRFV